MPSPVGLVDNDDGKPSVNDAGTGGPPGGVPSLTRRWSYPTGETHAQVVKRYDRSEERFLPFYRPHGPGQDDNP